MDRPAAAAPPPPPPQVNLKGEAAQLLEPGMAAPAAAAGAGGPPAAGAGAAPATVVSAASGEWSEEQELALVKALKQVGKDAEDRWGQVGAALVVVWVGDADVVVDPCVPAPAAAMAPSVPNSGCHSHSRRRWLAAAAACRPRLTTPRPPAGTAWPQVAALVPGKTKAQCFKRFKELKEAHKAKKAG